MDLPIEVADTIAEALEALQHDPQHGLAPGFRWRLQELIVELALKEGLTARDGHKAWLTSEIMAARHVLPLWEAQFPNDRIPQNMLAEAELFQREGLNPDQTQRPGFAISESTGTGTPVQYALGAAVAAYEYSMLAEAYHDLMSEYDRDFSLTNLDLEYPHGWDAALCASVAYADDESLTADFAREKRLEFWKWWLAEAVPKAFESVLGFRSSTQQWREKGT